MNIYFHICSIKPVSVVLCVYVYVCVCVCVCVCSFYLVRHFNE